MTKPTYSSHEVRLKLVELDYEGLIILGQLLAEEKELYDPEEFGKLHSAWNYMLEWEIQNRGNQK